jgi:hypothetical protein
MGTLDRAATMVADLTAQGVQAVTDPAAAVPPCVLVPPPVRRYDIGCGYTIVWTLWALAPGAGDAETWAALDDLVDQVADLLPIDQARPARYQVSPDAQAVPAYAITYEEAS